LTIQLKRFEYGIYGGGKIKKQISFGETLDLKNYINKNYWGEQSTVYNLYAILVHSGTSTRSGHYYSFVKGSNGIWYRMDDSHVSEVSLGTVLKQEAYILFYNRFENSQSISKSIDNISKKQEKKEEKSPKEQSLNADEESISKKRKGLPTTTENQQTTKKLKRNSNQSLENTFLSFLENPILQEKIIEKLTNEQEKLEKKIEVAKAEVSPPPKRKYR